MKDLKSALLMLLIFTVICGGIYPAVVTGIAQMLFPHQANGSLIMDRSGKVIGSSLIGQPFSDPNYLWPRPSATGDFGYNPLASGGSNSGPTNPDFIKTVSDRVTALRDGGLSGNIPSDLVLASASGLDPHISPEAARVQILRIARSRGTTEEAVEKVVARHTEERQFGILGAPRVNVLAVNMELATLIP